MSPKLKKKKELFLISKYLVLNTYYGHIIFKKLNSIKRYTEETKFSSQPIP